ncbi:MAG: transglycosylase domain-containing protein [Candidatus Paceibacterota bacterium]
MFKRQSKIIQIGIKLTLVALIMFFILAGISVIWLINLPIPDFNSFEERVVLQSTKIYDRSGEILLYDVHENIKRTIIPIEEVSEYQKLATIAIEDEDFYNHAGVKPTAIIRAFIINLLTGTIEQGGSTITQQVIKNTLLTQDKKLSRKFKELILALKVEQSFSKDKILEFYLNETPYGGNIYGIEEAAKTYFGKNAADLSLAESAYLAALPQAPTYLSPYGNNQDRLENRKNKVLNKMLDLDFINPEEYKEAMAEEIFFLKPDNYNIRAPHFVFFVLDQLNDRYGEETVRNGGLKVITTLDWTSQQLAEEKVRQFGTENIVKFNANNAGMVVIDPKSGEILSLVGSIDYFDIENEGNFNITTARRQPGSAFKPFVYAAALEKGYTPETVVFDLPTEFNVNCSPTGIPNIPGVDCYSPVNYDGLFFGPINFKQALAGSRNIPAVKVLYLTGINNAINLARNFGISTLTDASRYGLTLVLGGGEVTLLELTNAYGVFATDGIYHRHNSILKIENANGEIIDEKESKGTKVLSSNTARQISDMLSDNEARIPSFSPNSLLNIPGRQVAVKTGTTNDYRDAWIIGYTPEVVIGAWAGNNDNSPMERRVAGMIIAPLWNSFTTEYLSNNPVSRFNPPEPTPDNLKPVLRGNWRGSHNYYLNINSGKLATETTPPELKEEKVVTQIHSILHWVDKNNPRGPIPSNPGNNEQYRLWEAPVRKWLTGQGIIEQDISIIPTERDNTYIPNNTPEVLINMPEIINDLDKVVKISLTTTNNIPIKQVDYFINGVYLGVTKNNPFSFSFIPQDINGLKEKNTLKIIVYNEFGNKKDFYQTFTIEL